MKQKNINEKVTLISLTMKELKESKEEIPRKAQVTHYLKQMQYCKAEILADEIMGTLSIPNKKNLLGEKIQVGYCLDEDHFLLVGEETDTAYVLGQLKSYEASEEADTVDVFTDLLNHLIGEEVTFLQDLENRLSCIEEGLLTRIPRNFYQTVIQYRKQLLILHTYYEQLINMADTIENGNSPLIDDRERQRFTSFGARAERLHDHVEMLREYVLQIREMYQTQIDISQNHTMNLLTVVTSLFLPLSLLVGWYGMNFINMPELKWQYSYPALIGVSALILIIEIRLFKKKGLL